MQTHCGRISKGGIHEEHTCITCWHTDHPESPSNACNICKNLACFWYEED